jgi:hypothetical protein
MEKDEHGDTEERLPAGRQGGTQREDLKFGKAKDKGIKLPLLKKKGEFALFWFFYLLPKIRSSLWPSVFSVSLCSSFSVAS